MDVVTICSDFEAQENKVSHCFPCFPSICHEVMGLDAMIFVFWMLSFKPAFSLSSFTFIKRLFSSFLLSAIKVVSSEYLRLLKYGLFIYKQKVKLSASSLPTIQCWGGNRITIMRLLLEKGRIINTNSHWVIVIAKHVASKAKISNVDSRLNS